MEAASALEAASAVGGGARVGAALRPYLRLVVVAVVLLATLSNTVAGVRFTRSRTVYVRGLENQIITSAALLQSSAQMANAVDNYPIWGKRRRSRVPHSQDARGPLPPPAPAEAEPSLDDAWRDPERRDLAGHH